jgi:hypothetical protein
MNPNIIAELIPELVTSNMPVTTPIKPCFSASAIAPWVRELPKEVIGIVAPAPAKSINGSYRPNPSNTEPTTTKIHNVCAGVSFATSNNSCPTTQMRPPTINAVTKIETIIHTHFIVNSTACAMHGIVSPC